MAAKSTIELLLAFKEKVTKGVSGVKKKVTTSVNSMKQKITNGTREFMSKNAEVFDHLKGQVPFLGQLGGLLANPYVLAAGAVIALIGFLGKATMAASAFSYEFLDIRQLNLDKPTESLNNYRDEILDLSYETGIATSKMSKGFYDVQSATGLFGKDVKDLASQVSEYSIATKADFNDSVNSTVKAMKAFGFGVDEVTNYLASNAKTVQVGITTFDELARVQTEFAGAAAGANQTFDTSNKLFAAFTAIAKDSTIAATLTKSALEGLTQKRTTDELKKMGVSLFDAKGQIRSLDDVIRELTPKLQGMSDIEFLKVRNAIGGPEGLQSLLNTLKSSGDDVLNTMSAFDKSSFSMDQALKNAKGEFKVIQDELQNKIQVSLIKIGNEILPAAATALKGISWLFDRLKNTVSFIYRLWLLQWRAVKGLWELIKYAFTWLGEKVNWLYNLLGGEGNLWDQMFGTLDKWQFKIKTFFEDLAVFASKTFRLIEAGISGDLTEAKKLFDELRGFSFRDATAMYDATGQRPGATPGSSTGSIDTGTATDVEGGVSGSQQVRNLTINIESFVRDGINIVKEGDTKSMSETELEDWFNRMMMRVIRNVETSVQ